MQHVAIDTAAPFYAVERACFQSPEAAPLGEMVSGIQRLPQGLLVTEAAGPIVGSLLAA